MVDVVDIPSVTWVIEIVETDMQVVTELTTQVVSEDTKIYQVIDTASNASEVIETTTTQYLEEQVISVVEVTPESTNIEVVESSPVVYYTEEKMPYATKIDTISETVLYKGEATPGASTNSTSWRIQKIVFSDNGNDVDIFWAEGEASFTKSWDNRLTYNYT